MTKVEKFNQWMQKIGNIYFADNERMLNAYTRIYE